MAQRSNLSNFRRGNPTITASVQAVVERLEARQLLSGTMAESLSVGPLDVSAAAETHASQAHASDQKKAPSVSQLAHREAKIAAEIAAFTNHLHHEVTRHINQAYSLQFQAHIAREQAQFAHKIAKQGGSFTPIPYDTLLVGTPAPAVASPVLSGTSTSATQITLTWTTVAGATYQVQTSTNGGRTWLRIASLSALLMTYSHSGLIADSSHSYRVMAIKGGKTSAPSNVITLKTQLTAPTGLRASNHSATEIDLTWTPVTDATSYKIERSPDNTKWTALVPSPALTASSISYADATAASGTSYYYRISAIGTQGTSAPSTVATAATFPAAPGMTSTVISATEIDLSWSTVTGATSYKLETSLNGGATWTTLATQSTTTFKNTGLTADNTYKYRVSAIDPAGPSVPSSAVTATTLLNAPTGLIATPVSTTEIDLAWTPVVDATSYKIERSPDNTKWTALTPSPALTGSSITYADTTATAGATFYYRISAISAAGTSAPSTAAHALTLPGASTLTATSKSAAEIDLSWTSVTGATNYILQSSSDGGTTWTQIASQSTLTFANTGLSADTAYQYRVISVDATGNSAPSTVATKTTFLGAPTGLTARAVSPTEIDLTWNAVADATGFKLERSPDNTSWAPLTPSPALTGSSISYADTTASAGKTYYYRLSAINALGTSSASTVASALTVPSAPTLTATVFSPTQVNLSWTAPAGATSYTLQSSTDGGSTWTTLATQATLTYSNTALTADSSYKYRVLATDAAGNSAPSAVASVVTLLLAPTGLTSTAVSPTEIDLAWNPVVDATNYKIERSPDGNTWTTLTLNPALSGSSSTYADTGLTAGATYYYRISSIDAAGTSVAASPVHALTYPSAPTVTAAVASATQINLTWVAVKTAASYLVEISSDGGSVWSTAGTVQTLTYSSSSLNADTLYKYRVSAINPTGTSVPSAVVSATTLLAAPTGLTATAVSAGEIDLTWNAVPDATGFKLERSPDNTAWAALTPSPALTGTSVSYADTTVKGSSTYYYRISAIDAAGTSAASTVAHTSTVPGTPTLTATVISASQINLTWVAVTGATSYTLQRSADAGATWSTVTSPTTTSYSDNALSSDTAYKYRLAANSATGASANSTVVTATTLLGPPSSFAATPHSATEIDLGWTAVADATSYKIERSQNQTAWTALTPNPALTGSSASYNDTTATAGTTYYYRITAMNAAGNSVASSLVHALTQPVAPTLTATVISASSVGLSWTAPTSATTYLVELSADGGTTWNTLAQSTSLTFTATGLTSDTLYKFRVSAGDASGNSAPSTVAPVTTLLAAPAGFTATAHSTTEVDLAWTAVTDATNYKIERSTDNTTWTTLTPSPALTGTSATYNDTSLTAGTTYFYRISAMDAVGTSAPASTVSALTYPAVSTLTATPTSATVVSLSWTASKSATSYLLESSSDGGTTWTTAVTQAGTSYNNTGLTADTAYQYRVTAINATGNSAASTVANATTLLPSPTGLAATVASATEIDLAWTAVTDATSYKIERSTDNVNWTTLQPNPALTSSSVAYNDTSVSAGTTYYYRLSAVNASGTSLPEAAVNALTDPAAPTLTATVASATQVNLSWTASKSATSYLLESSSDGGTTWTTAATQAGTTFNNTGLTADTAYQFRVTGINATGNSAASSIAHATTLLGAPTGFTATVASATEIDLAWTAVTDATSYKIERSLNQTVWTTLQPNPALTSSSVSYNDTSVLAGTTYYYRISAINAVGTSVPSAVIHPLTDAAAPTLTATVASATQVNLSWTATKSATSYLLESSSDGGTTWTTAATQAGTTFNNTGLTADTAYQFRVTAINATGNSAASTVANATTLLTAPTGFTATVASATEIDLAWTAVTDATNYKIERSPDNAIWTTIVPNPALTSSSVAYNDTTVLAGTTYYYRISAIDAAGTSAPATAIHALTVPAASTLTAYVASATQVNLSWTASKSATSYLLESSSDGGTTWTTAATQAGTTFNNTGLTADTAYQFRVTGINATGNSAASTVVHATTLLGAPTGFAATVASATEIDLAWTAVTDATNYKIERSTDNINWTTLVPNPALTSSSVAYNDTTLSAGTTYYYRISAIDATSRPSAPATAIHALTDAAAPTLTATVASATQVNLSWTASKSATSYLLESSSDGGTTWTTAATQAGTTFNNTGLIADTAYQFRVTAINATGNSAASSVANATTLLGAPTGFTATVASATEIDLAWTAVTDATSYKIERSVNQSIWTTLTPNPALTSSSVSYNDTSVSAGTTYYYRISAIDASSRASAPAAVIHALTDPAAPTFTAYVVSATQITLTWTSTLSATNYLLESSSDGGTTWTTAATQAGTTFNDTGLTADTAYQFRVSAINATGNSATSTVANVTTLLGAPTGFAATVVSATEIDLAWTAVTDATSYKIERSIDNVNWTTLAPNPALTSSSVAYNDTSVSGGTTYYYRISAIDAASRASATSAAIHALTDAAAPTLTALPQLSTEIDLSWNPVDSATSYLLETSSDGGTTWTTLATQAGTTYANTGLTADTAYQYRVTAINATGNSAASSVVTATTLLDVPAGFTATAASSTEVDLAWTASTDATSYQIEVSNDQQGWSIIDPTVALTGSSVSYHDTTVVAGTTYYYRLSAINAQGISVPTAAVTVTTPLVAPTGLTATAVSASQINLTWTADTDAGLTGFVLQSSTDNIAWANDITIAPASTSVSDVRLTAATKYYYRLLAVNAGGNSAPSTVVNATTTA